MKDDYWKNGGVETNNISPTLDTRCDCFGVVVRDNGMEDKVINPLKGKTPYGWHFEQNIYNENGIIRGLKASGGSGNIPKLILRGNSMEKDLKIIGNYSPSGHDTSRIVDTIGIPPTVKENHGTITAINSNLRIRKLTPTECFRLMGVKDEDSNKLNHLSNSTKYHLAGDSIVVNVLQAIFKSILIDNPVLDNKPIKLIELFGGYGSQALALKYLDIDFEHWKLCEWAIKSIDAYKHIHYTNTNEDYTKNMAKDDLVDYLYKKGISSNWNEPMTYEQVKRKKESELREIYNNCKITKNLINIQQVHSIDLEIRERERNNYLLTYSFPCQDLSLAGKGMGMEKGSGTRSGMLWEVERILEECGNELPQMLLMENVPQVVGKNNKTHFDKWVEFLEKKGYTNKYCMLNAKEVGYPEPIPQNRNRCFMVSVLNPKCEITFPGKSKRKLVLKNLLEEYVDKKYYLSDKMITYISSNNEKWLGNNNKSLINKEIASTINTGEGSKRCDASNYISSNCINNLDLKDVVRKYGIFDDEKSNHQAGSVYDKNGLSPTLDTMQGGYRQPMIEETFVSKHYNNFLNKNGYTLKMFNPWNEKEIKEIAPTQSTQCGSTTSTATILIKEATKQGYKEAIIGDGINISNRMQYQRGNVQSQSIQTITTTGGNDRGVVIEEDKWSDLD